MGEVRTCRIEGCDKPRVQTSSMCAMHRARQTRTGSPYIRTLRVRVTSLPCTVPGCKRLRKANGLCAVHDQRKRRHGHHALFERPYWAEREIDALLHVERHPKSGHVMAGEYERLSIELGRTVAACASMMFELRKAGRAPPTRHPRGPLPGPQG